MNVLPITMPVSSPASPVVLWLTTTESRTVVPMPLSAGAAPACTTSMPSTWPP